MSAAQDRETWRNAEVQFIQAHDPPWASGKQPSLANLAPTPGGRRRPGGGLPLQDAGRRDTPRSAP